MDASWPRGALLASICLGGSPKILGGAKGDCQGGAPRASTFNIKVNGLPEEGPRSSESMPAAPRDAIKCEDSSMKSDRASALGKVPTAGRRKRFGRRIVRVLWPALTYFCRINTHPAMGAASSQIATASSSGVLSLIDAITFTASPARVPPRSVKTSTTAAASVTA